MFKQLYIQKYAQKIMAINYLLIMLGIPILLFLLFHLNASLP